MRRRTVISLVVSGLAVGAAVWAAPAALAQETPSAPDPAVQRMAEMCTRHMNEMDQMPAQMGNMMRGMPMQQMGVSA